MQNTGPHFYNEHLDDEKVTVCNVENRQNNSNNNIIISNNNKNHHHNNN